jgi:hypothetical protein
MKQIQKAVPVAPFLTALLLSCPACDAESNSSNGGSGGGAPPGGGSGGENTGGSGGAGGIGGAGGSESDCDPACPSGQFCSIVGECIDDGTCRDTPDCNAGFICQGGECVLGEDCGTQEFDLQTVPPNLLILLDRSCSMPDCAKYGLTFLVDCMNTGTTDKWGEAVDVLTQVTNAFMGQVQWGLEFFPDSTGDPCLQDAPVVPPAAGTEGAIQQLLASALQVSDPNFPDGPCVTNINAAIQSASEAPSLNDPTRGNFVLLLTDGVEFGCTGNNAVTQGIITDLASRGVNTFVVGYGITTGAFLEVDPAVLNDFAVAGGMPNADPNIDYYAASDPNALQASLSNIVGRITGCDFALDEVPPNIDEIYVWANDTESLERDSPDGWSYDEAGNRVIINGQACEDLQNGVITDIDVVFGCDAPVIE